jgi:hypothetical protein
MLEEIDVVSLTPELHFLLGEGDVSRAVTRTY